MKKIIILIILCISVFSSPAAKKKSPVLRNSNLEAGLTIATNGDMSLIAFSGIKYWKVGRGNGQFKVGVGPRITSSFGGKKLEYITAPAILTSGKKGPGVFFANQLPENIDTLQLASTQINSINLFLALRYDFKKKWGIEFNIDLLGLSFGASKQATLLYGEHNNSSRTTMAEPFPRNALLISDNDFGSLNSEWMVSYAVKKNMKLKAGFNFLFNEYQVKDPILYTNSKGTVIGTDRYRNKSLCIGVGANYVINNKKK